MSPPVLEKKRKYDEHESIEGATNETAVSTEESAPVYVECPGENDVLMGRGKPIISNEGNKRFRLLVRSRKDEYSSTSRTHIKEAIARDIIQEIGKRKGRFLEQVQRSEATDAGFSDTAKVWKIVKVKVALNKVKQSLRDRDYVKSEDRTAAQVSTAEVFNPTIPSNQLLRTIPQAGLQQNVIDNQRRLAIFQQQMMMEQQRQAMVLRAQQLQGLHGLQGYNNTLALQQSLLASSQANQGFQLPLGFGIGNNQNLGRILDPNEQRLRELLLSQQLLQPGQNQAASNPFTANGVGPFPLPQQQLQFDTPGLVAPSLGPFNPPNALPHGQDTLPGPLDTKPIAEETVGDQPWGGAKETSLQREEGSLFAGAGGLAPNEVPNPDDGTDSQDNSEGSSSLDSSSEAEGDRKQPAV